MNDQPNPGFQPAQPNPQPSPQPSPSNFSNFQNGSAQPTTPIFNAGNAVPQPSNSALATPAPVEDRRPLMYTVIIVVMSAAAITFVGLFIWMYSRWSDASTDVGGQIQAATAVAVAENTTALENEFAEREKSPYKTFSGPTDYGELSFEYPKTWSVYIAKDASSGSGDFEAYLNPDVVNPVDSSTINALRVTIKDSSYDSVAKNFESKVKNGKLTVSVRQIGGSNANLYSGEINNDLQGMFALLKIRDKAVILQTDAMVFQEDFYRVLDTVSYNS